MAVYVDNMRSSVQFPGKGVWKMSHMIADTRSELDEMAERLELDSKFKQNAGERNEHFDVTENFRQRAIRYGAIGVTPKELVRKLLDRNLAYYLEH